MKILVAYYSKSGTAADCANILKKDLAAANGVLYYDVTLADLSKESPDVMSFDAIVLGTSIRMGKPGKVFTEYVNANHDALTAKIHGFFICCGMADDYKGYLEKYIPADLRNTAFGCDYFGADLRPERQRGIDRIILKMMRAAYFNGNDVNDAESDIDVPTISEPTISQFAEILKRLLSDT